MHDGMSALLYKWPCDQMTVTVATMHLLQCLPRPSSLIHWHCFVLFLSAFTSHGGLQDRRTAQPSKWVRVGYLTALDESEAPGFARDTCHRPPHLAQAVLGVMPDQASDQGRLADPWGAMHQHNKWGRLVIHRLHGWRCRVRAGGLSAMQQGI